MKIQVDLELLKDIIEEIYCVGDYIDDFDYETDFDDTLFHSQRLRRLAWKLDDIIDAAGSGRE